MASFSELIIKLGVDLDQLKRGLAEAQTRLKSFGERAEYAGERIGVVFGVAGGAIAAGLGFAVAKAATFEAQLAKVGALANASSADLEALRKAALDLGATTSLSASQVAEGMQELAAMGFSVQQIIAAMPGVIAAAEASGEDLALVSRTVAAALNSWGLEAQEAARVADILAKAANISAAGVEDMSYAFKYAAPFAKQFGVSIEELSAAVAIMANAGLRGEQAGTALRMAFIRLADPPKEAAEMLQKLGIQVSDSSGKMLPFGQIIAQLSEKFRGLSQEQRIAAAATIFGAEAASGMLALIDAGPAKFNEFTNALRNSSGASAEAAAKMKDNLMGTLQELQGAFETAQISIGTALAPAIGAVVEALKGLFEWFNNLSPSTQRFIAVALALTAALFVLISVIGFLVAGLGMLAAAQWAVILPWMGIIAAVVAATAVIGALAVVIVTHWEQIKEKTLSIWEEIKSFLVQTWQSIRDGAFSAWSALVGFFKSVWDQIGPPLKAFWEGIKAFFVSWWNTVKPIFTTGWDMIKTVFTSAFEAIKAIVSAGWEIIKSIFATAFLTVYYIVTGQWDKINQVWEAAKKKIITIVTTLWDRIVALWNASTQKVVTFLTTLWTKMIEIWTMIYNAVTQKVTELVYAVVDWFAKLPGRIMEKLTILAATIKQKWIEIKNDAIEAGRNIIQGFIDGVMSMAGALWDAVTGVVRRAVEAAEGFLGISSPSKVFAQIGEWTAAGFAAGIMDGVRMVEGAVANVMAVARTVATTTIPATVPPSLPLLPADSGGGNVTVNITVYANSYEEFKNKLARDLARYGIRF